MAEATQVKGTQRAAILLMTLGEQTAASVLKHMDIGEVQKLGLAMAGLADVPRERVTDVLGQLLVAVHTKTPIGMGTNDYLRKVMTDSIGERRAGALLGRILKGGRESTGIDALKWMEPRAVAEIVKSEHPQIVATILAHLPSQQAADVLKELDAASQADIAMRMARLDEVPETALQELDGIVERQTKEATTIKTAKLGGVKAAADMINLLGPAQSSMIEKIQAEDAELGELIKDALFVFDNLLDIDDRGMQAILREVQADSLATALKGADEEIREKIFKNMSKRAAEILRDDIASKGPVRVSEVEQAQKEILAVVLRLSEEGTIMLTAGGDEFV